MRRKFGIALIVLGIVLTLVFVGGVTKNITRIVEMYRGVGLPGENANAYRSGYVIGAVITNTIMGLITVALYYYGVKFSKSDKPR